MAVMDRIVIGVDPHTASWTGAVVDAALQPLDTLRVPEHVVALPFAGFG